MKIILYTHSDVDWVHPYWHQQTDKFLKDFEKVMFINDSKNVNRDDYHIITYDDNLTYKNRVLKCLDFLDEELVVLFNHEDMFLYDSPNLHLLKEMEELVKTNEVHLIKLLRNGDYLNKYKNYDYLYYNHFGFSIQPTIAKVKTLKRIFSEIQGETIWSFEENSMNKVNNIGFVNLMIYDGKNKRGLGHWDSGIYPYVATAVVKGKWNSEYSIELERIKNNL